MIVTKLYSLGAGRTSGCCTQALSMIHLSQRHSSSTTQLDNGNQITGSKRVAVLGAGVSGLAATKSCLDEGLEPVCFEQANTIGGIWNFNKNPAKNSPAGVYEDLVMNMSKQMTRFSDFPIPEHLPTFLNSHQFLQYLNSYTDHFRLRGHIKFNTKIQKVSPLEPEAIDGPWRIHFKDSAGKESAEDFAGVIVCTGAYTKPTLPEIEGLESFKGEVVHMANVRTSDFMRGKRVLVIGNQNSAGDVAVLAAKVAKEVTLSVGANGTYIVPRCRHDGMPVDVTVSRIKSMYAPKWFRNRELKAIANHHLDHAHHGLAASVGPYSGANMCTTDHLGPLIKDGKVKVTQNAERIDGHSVHYSDGSVGGPYDVIVCATGYVPDFKHVEAKVMQGHSRLDYPIYKGVFPVYSDQPTIASIGLTQNYGACPPVFELQGRWAARVFAGKCRLPDPDSRRDFWERKRNMYLSNRGKAKESSWGILDEVSSEFGVRPTFWKILPRSPLLAFRFLFGPVLSTHFRLVGPGMHYDAWQDSLDTYDSIFHPKEKPERGIHAPVMNAATASAV